MIRRFGTTSKGADFSEPIIEAVWQKGKPGPDSTSLRKDTCGATMQRDRYGRETPYGWEIDHIKPVSRGGTDDLANLQPLQWANNRHKSDDWPDWQCKNRT